MLAYPNGVNAWDVCRACGRPRRPRPVVSISYTDQQPFLLVCVAVIKRPQPKKLDLQYVTGNADGNLLDVFLFYASCTAFTAGCQPAFPVVNVIGSHIRCAWLDYGNAMLADIHM